jgi:aminoglycoside phosphotransferase (APT) family kinase protein
VIGSPFFLRRERRGVVRGEIPDSFGGGDDVETNRKLSTVVIDTLAEFHAVDPAECGLDDLGHPEGFLERQVEGWTRRWEKAKHEDFAPADEVGAWLASELPQPAVTTLLHNDWRLDNMAVSPDGPGNATAV